MWFGDPGGISSAVTGHGRVDAIDHHLVGRGRDHSRLQHAHPRTAILEYRQHYGDKAWKVHSGYHRRSLAETAMSRLKTRFGERLSHRRFDTQTTQAYARLAAMNIMTRLGMPDTVVAC